jgi:hypothetical protein
LLKALAEILKANTNSSDMSIDWQLQNNIRDKIKEILLTL